jgi:hypothetical protein
MKAVALLVLVVVRHFLHVSSSNQTSAATSFNNLPDRSAMQTFGTPDGQKNTSCPFGLFYDDNTTCCRCGKELPRDIIKCKGVHLRLFGCICATVDHSTRVVSAGMCIFSCGPHDELKFAWRKKNFKSSKFCTQKGRMGKLCGECLPDHYPLAYSFNMSCILCKHVGWNWGKYIMAAYLPLTFFSFFILFFKIQATSGHLFVIVTFCQSMSIPVLVRFVSRNYSTSLAKVLFSLYGVWNLDFFRFFYSDLCLGIGILPTLALDYAIAVYPLLLMIISYLLIVLYDRNYRVVTIMWRPFQILFSLFRRKWDIRTSIVDAYATFFLLSNIKLLSVSFDLLIPTFVYQINADNYNRSLNLFYSGDIEYFGRKHLPYAILAIVVTGVFVILPIAILLLYPFTFFQKFLNLFPVRWYVLHTFVDSFQGCYKDGTEPGTRDCRWFSVVYLLCRIAFLIIYSVELNSLGTTYITLILLCVVIALMILKPFKKDRHTFINAIFTQLFAGMCVGLSSTDISMHRAPKLIVFLYIGAALPLIYAALVLAYWLFRRRKLIQRQISNIRARVRGYDELPDEQRDEPSDRILHPECYSKNNLASFVTPEN